MPSINLTDPINGTVTDATLIAANNNIIEGVINGGIDDNNISSGAALSPSKIAGYPSDGSKALLGNGLWGTLAGAVFRANPVTLTATTLTNIISQSIPGGTLGANRKMRISIGGDLKFAGLASGFHWQIQYGSVVFWEATAPAVVTDPDRGGWFLLAELAALTTGTQALYGRFGCSTRAPATVGVGSLGGADILSGSFASNGALAVDSTVAQTLSVKAALTNANANNDIRVQAAMVEVIG